MKLGIVIWVAKTGVLKQENMNTIGMWVKNRLINETWVKFGLGNGTLSLYTSQVQWLFRPLLIPVSVS